MKENTDAHKVILKDDDINELETVFATLGVFGNRAPEGLKASHDIGTSPWYNIKRNKWKNTVA